MSSPSPDWWCCHCCGCQRHDTTCPKLSWWRWSIWAQPWAPSLSWLLLSSCQCSNISWQWYHNFFGKQHSTDVRIECTYWSKSRMRIYNSHEMHKLLQTMNAKHATNWWTCVHKNSWSTLSTVDSSQQHYLSPSPSMGVGGGPKLTWLQRGWQPMMPQLASLCFPSHETGYICEGVGVIAIHNEGLPVPKILLQLAIPRLYFFCNNLPIGQQYFV